MCKTRVHGDVICKAKLKGIFDYQIVKTYVVGDGESWWEDPTGQNLGEIHYLEEDTETLEPKYPDEYEVLSLYNIEPDKHPIEKIIEIFDAIIEEDA